MPWMTISCGNCGHVDDFDAFTIRQVSGSLPPGQYQCPACNFAWQVRQAGPGRHYVIEGKHLFIPGKLELKRCAPML